MDSCLSPTCCHHHELSFLEHGSRRIPKGLCASGAQHFDVHVVSRWFHGFNVSQSRKIAKFCDRLPAELMSSVRDAPGVLIWMPM